MLGKTFTQDALGGPRGLGRRARAAALRARAQGGAGRAGRSALARARPVRLPAGPRAPRRLRDALEARAPGQASGRRRPPDAAFTADEDEVVEVVASHFLAAFEAAPDADDADEIKGKAQEMLVRAGERAESLAAAAEARRYFEQAAELDGRAAGAGRAARPRGRDGRESRGPGRSTGVARGVDLPLRGRGRHARGRRAPAARAHRWFTGQLDQALARRAGPRVIRTTSPTRTLRCSPELSRSLTGSAAISNAQPSAPSSRSTSPRARASPRRWRGSWCRRVRCLQPRPPAGRRFHEARARGRPRARFRRGRSRRYFILSDRCFRLDRTPMRWPTSTSRSPLAPKLGNRPYEWAVLAERTYPLFMLGRWDEAIATGDEFTEERIGAGA